MVRGERTQEALAMQRSFTCTPDLAAWIDARASIEDRSRSGMIERAVSEYRRVIVNAPLTRALRSTRHSKPKTK